MAMLENRRFSFRASSMRLLCLPLILRLASARRADTVGVHARDDRHFGEDIRFGNRPGRLFHISD